MLKILVLMTVFFLNIMYMESLLSIVHNDGLHVVQKY